MLISSCLLVSIFSFAITESKFLLLRGRGEYTAELCYPDNVERNKILNIELDTQFHRPAIAAVKFGCEDLVIIAGGYDKNYMPHNTTQFVFPNKGIIMKGPEMNSGRVGVIMATLNNIVYACGGGTDDDDEFTITCERFKSGKWEYIATPDLAMYSGESRDTGTFNALVATKKYLYLVRNVMNEMIRYSPITNRWMKVASPDDLFVMEVGAVAVGENIYVCGGDNDLHECYRYSESENRWSTIANMSVARSGFVMLPVGQKIYAIGGNNHVRDTAVEVYDVLTNKWSKVESIIGKHDFFAGVVLHH